MKKLTKQEQRDEALEAYRAIIIPASRAYDVAIANDAEAAINPPWKAYIAIQDLAYEAFLAKLKEIDPQEDGRFYLRKLTMKEPTRYKMSRFEDSELKPTEPQIATANSYLLSNKLVDDNDSTSSAKNAQHQEKENK